MRLVSSGTIVSILVFAAALPATASPRLHRGPTAPRASRVKAAVKPVSTRAIEPERVTQIQSALISAGYLNGTPSGAWDAETQAAMTRLQADNGWQTKLIPDSRAIIKLGLGPTATASAEPGELTPAAEPTSTPSQ